MKYKGYIGVVQFDADAMIFCGEVSGLEKAIIFSGATVEELKKEFEVSIDGYLKWCKELGEEPEKPYSGTTSNEEGPTIFNFFIKVFVLAAVFKMLYFLFL